MSDPKAAEMKQKILDTAMALWNEKGYADATMRELAKRLGMGVSSLYFYFRSKEEIVLYLYRNLNERAIARFRAEKEDADLGKNLVRFLELKLAILEPYRSCCVGIFKEAVDPQSALNPFSSESSDVLDRTVGLFRDLVERSGAGKGDEALRLARVLWFAHLAVILYWLHDRSPESAKTKRMGELLAKGAGMLKMFGGMFGQSEVFDLVSSLFEAGPAPAAPKSAVVPETPPREVDVVVAGAGPIGALYASFLKLQRPRTRILVLERSTEPGHKIGESTLSGFIKALRTVGIRQDVLRRLFYPKNGLGFHHVEESTPDVAQAPEYVLETFNETFQVERRVLDSLVLANARRLGVEVIQGATVDIARSELGRTGDLIRYTVGSREFRVKTTLLVDATGPAGVLSRHLKLHTKEGLTFQTSAVWTYYQNVRSLDKIPGWKGKSQFGRDTYTQHLSLKEGWLWYIPIVSWQEAPSANLDRMIRSVVGARRAPASRDDLAAEYGCPWKDILSVGLVLRSDRDAHLKDDVRAAFEHYSRKYPAIRRLLQGGEVLENYYGTGETFMSRMTMRGYSRQVAGDGWLLVGDAAFFVDPLISPGLTGGTCQAFQAAGETARALDHGGAPREAFAEYEAFVHRLHDALERDNQLVYMSFNHPEATALIQRFQEIDARRHFNETENKDYSIEDTNIWGILTPSYQEMQKRVWAILREEEQAVGTELSVDEQSPRDYERLVARLRDCLGPYVEAHEDLTPYVTQNRR
jgi:flavin-dependent dehydrogenase/AcrR family transcriptional regulator